MFFPKAIYLSSFEPDTHTIVFNKKNWYRSFTDKGEEFLYSIFHILMDCDGYNSDNQQRIAAGVQVIKQHGKVELYRDGRSKDFISYRYQYDENSGKNIYYLRINTYYESFNEHRFAFSNRAANNFIKAFIAIDALYEATENVTMEQ